MASQQNKSNEAELEALFISLARVTLDHMEEWATSEGIPQSFHRLVDFTKDGTRSRFEMKRGYTKLLLLHLDDPLWTTKEVEDCIRQHRLAWNFFPLEEEEEEDSAFNPLPDSVDGILLQGFWFFIIDVLEKYGTFQLTQEQLVESYDRIRNLREAKSWRWDVTIPLLGFSSDIERKEPVSAYLQLTPFSPEEKTALWNQNTDESEIDALRLSSVRDVDLKAFSHTQFKLTGTFVAEGRGLYDQQQLFNEVENILTALRLAKAGDVGILAFFSRIYIPNYSRLLLLTKLPKQRMRKEKSTYRLSEADLATVKTLYASLRQLDKQKSDLAVALRRFNEVYSRDIPEDRIIDLIVALESCLLAGSKEREKKKKLSARGAALLSGNRKRNETNALLSEMYDVRNSIVHGGMRLIDLQKDKLAKLQRFGIPPYQFSTWCEKIVREILKEYVLRQAKNQSVEQVNQELDRRILEGLTPLSNGEEK